VSGAPESSGERLHVVAAVIRRADGAILISHRPDHVEQGGLWEFPGGKLHRGEARVQGLARELREELGLDITRATPLLTIPHDYPTRRVLLDVFVVDAWRGEAEGREGQRIRWVAPDALASHAFPAANLPIVTAARLPRAYVVTPEPTGDENRFLAELEACLVRGARLIQLRAPSLAADGYRALAQRVLAVCRDYDARLLLNAEPALCMALGADGVHLNGRRLQACTARPLPRDRLLSAACHDATALALAQRVGVDVVLLSPVLPTATHPGVATLGWHGLAALAAAATLPVYALGGLGPADLGHALEAGCVGIAGIGQMWGGAAPLSDAALLAGL
jgi:8-oxo-dGTP diphosphatase